MRACVPRARPHTCICTNVYMHTPTSMFPMYVKNKILYVPLDQPVSSPTHGTYPAASLPKQAINITAQLITVNGSSIAAAASRLVAKSAPTITLRSRLNWQGEASMLIGILAGACCFLRACYKRASNQGYYVLLR